MTMGLVTHYSNYISPYFSAISEDGQNIITKFGPICSSPTHPASQHISSHINDIDIKAKPLQTPFRSLILPACYTKLMNQTAD